MGWLHRGHTGTCSTGGYRAALRSEAWGLRKYLNVLLVRTAASVVVILEVLGAEYFTTGVTLHREEIQLSAGFLTAMFTEVG